MSVILWHRERASYLVHPEGAASTGPGILSRFAQESGQDVYLGYRQGMTPQAKPRGELQGPGGPPANQHAKSALSTVSPDEFEVRPQRPCGAVPRAGVPLED